MSGTTDGGLGFGASFGIRGDDGDNADANVFISGTFGTITVGNDVGRANAVAALPDFGFDGMGVDDVVEDYQEVGSVDTRWTYTVGSLTVSASADLNSGANVNSTASASTDNAWGIGATYAANGLSLAVGYAEATNINGYGTTDAADDTATSFGLGYTSGAITLNAGYVSREEGLEDQDAMGVSVAYAIDGASSITVGYNEADVNGTAGDEEVLAVGYSQNLGGGATFSAAWASIDDTDQATATTALRTQTKKTDRIQVGLNFSF
jgi:outer membrane protein OmpU